MKTKGIYFLYRVLLALSLPLLLLYFVSRGLRDRRYWRSLPQRLGFLPASFLQTAPGAIWLHAVSLGEIIACLETLRRLRSAFPRTPIFVSTSTLAGYAAAHDKLGALAAGIFFAPADFCFAVRRVLRTLRPSLVIIAETEVWPNLFRETKRTGAALVIINARISDRALPRYLPLAPFFGHILPQCDAILAQNPTMRDRFLALGAPPDRTTAAGNLKFDFDPRPAPEGSPVRAFLAEVAPARVWIAASTMPGIDASDVDEDDAVIAAFQSLAPQHPGLLLIHVPRKPERFDLVAARLDAARIRYVRRSALPGRLTLPGVLLLDTIGELSGLFPLADVVFMGGTLNHRGGHNILEPALFARPVILGPHMENFQEIAGDFAREGATVAIASPSDLAPAVAELLAQPARAKEIGDRALAAAHARRGATERTLAELKRLFHHTLPAYRPAWPKFPIAWVLSRLWTYGSRRSLRRASLNCRHLPVPVVSIGNLNMGGTGKTPCALLLARALASSGHRPGILTRGYGRSSPRTHLTVAPGANVSAEHTGDEPQIFVRAAIAPIGIGPDRFITGTRLHQEFGIDVALLDDGFQHVRLARQLDLVLIDAISPFSGGHVFPLGRLREPLSALARADVFLITRSDYSDLGPAVENTLRATNLRAPIFRARVHPTAWVEFRSGKRFPAHEPPFNRAAGFCGLGNPGSFRRTVESLGVTLAEWVEFRDHHHYRPHELRRLAHLAPAAGAQAFVTTEKDSINFCEEAAHLLEPLPLYWLQVEMEIDREAELLALIEERLKIFPRR